MMYGDKQAALLFDIDGTLLDIYGAGKRAIQRTLESLGWEKFDFRLDFAGRTDWYIWENVLGNHTSDWRTYQDLYAKFLKQEMAKVEETPHIKEVREVLTQLKKRNFILGLVTGNVKAGAKIKLQRFGLWRFFDFGGFGDQHYSRDDIVAEALTKLSELHPKFSGKIFLVGDTEFDIKSAHTHNLIAVYIGGKSIKEFQHKPDFIIRRFREIFDILAGF